MQAEQESKHEYPKRSPLDYALLYVKGLGMGSADIIPGVSGGTIALLVGVYRELLESISNAGGKLLLGIFRKGGFKRYCEGIHIGFLLSLLLGIGTAVYAFSKLLTQLLESEPVLIWSFFFGLILASIWFVGKQVRHWTFSSIVGTIAGVLMGFALSMGSIPLHLPDSWFGFFWAGFIAICAMILPGISGSFILIILGKYKPILHSISDVNFTVLVPTAFGAVIGLGTFAHLLSWLLKRHSSVTLATLTGFIAGAIIRLWPWQVVKPGDAVTQPVLPSTYDAMGLNAEILPATALIGAGIFVVVILEVLGRRKGIQKK